MTGFLRWIWCVLIHHGFRTSDERFDIDKRIVFCTECGRPFCVAIFDFSKDWSKDA